MIAAHTRLILAHDLRVLWREVFAVSGLKSRIGILFFGLFFFAALQTTACVLVFVLQLPPGKSFQSACWMFVGLVVFLVAVQNAQLARADSALLLSSPVAPGAILLARLLGLLVASLAMPAFLIIPFFNAAVWAFGPRYLFTYPTFLCVGLLATCLAFAVTLGLVRWLGARRGVNLIRVAGALLLVLVVVLPQLTNLASKGQLKALLAPILADDAPYWLHLPARAGSGEPLSLSLLALLAIGSVVTLVQLAPDTLIRGVQEESEARGASRSRRSHRHRWTGSFHLAVYRKELRLLSRDPLLLVQCIPMLGMIAPILMGAREIGWGLLAVLACAIGQFLTVPLTQVSVAAEEAWDLVRSCPRPETQLRVAKMAAAASLPLLAAVLLCGIVAALDRPGLAACALFITVAGALAIGWLFIGNVEPAHRKRQPQKLKEGGLLRLLLTMLFINLPSMFGLAQFAKGQILLGLSLLGLALLACFLAFAFTQLREISEDSLESLRSTVVPSK